MKKRRLYWIVLWVSFIIFISKRCLYVLFDIYICEIDKIGFYRFMFFVDNVLSYVFDNLKSFKILFNNFCGLFKVYV